MKKQNSQFENCMVSGYGFTEPDYSGNPCCEMCGDRIEQEDAVYIPNYGYVCDSCLKDSRRDFDNA